MPDPKKQFSISLTEPVAFLRSSDPSGRLRPDPNDPPTLVRGLVTLNVVKPIKISIIEVELTGMLMVSWAEGEELKIYSSAVTVFSAAQALQERRTASVGPGLPLTYLNEQDDLPGRSVSQARPRSPPRGRSEHRSAANTDLGGPLSIDVAVEPSSRGTDYDDASPAPVTANDLGPTPPYTPARSSTIPQSRSSISADSPAQTLEDLRQALRDNLDSQGHWHGYASAPPSARSHSTPFPPLSLPQGHSSPSRISNVFLQQDRDGEPGYLESVSFSGPPSLDESQQFSLTPTRGISSNRTSRTNSPDNVRGTLPGTRENSREPSHTRAGRAHSRFSLGAVLNAVKEVTSGSRSRSRGFSGNEEGERGRTRVRLAVGEEVGDTIPEIAEGVAGPGNKIHPNGHENTQHHLSLGRVLGFGWDNERDKEGEAQSKEQDEPWREFKPGTYTYAISFLLPPNLPPSFSLPQGSLNYSLKAVAHRPGAFTSKLSCHVPLMVIAAPSVGAGEGGAGDPGPVTVEKLWEGKLAYVFGLSGRLFVVGSQRRLEVANQRIRADTESQIEAEVEARAVAAYGTAVLDLTMMPLEKVKIWRLTVSIDERVVGVDRGGKIVRDEEKRRITLLDLQDSCAAEELSPTDEEGLKQKNKQKKESVQIPLLPTPISPHRSPLLQCLPSSADPSTLAGPGPYVISTTIGLPRCHDVVKGAKLHFTVKQRSSCVRVEHTLRLTIRVELVGDKNSNESEDPGKKKMFDVAVQTPINILSCRCVPEYQALPRYSQIVEDNAQDLSACPCEPSNSTPPGGNYHHDHSFEHVSSSASTSSVESEIAAESHDPVRDVLGQTGNSRSTSRAQSLSHSRAPSRSGRNSHGRPPLDMHIHSNVHSHSRSHSHSLASYTHAYSPTPSSTPHPSRPPSPLARYERLVSGMESEAGEAPPSYESLAAGS